MSDETVYEKVSRETDAKIAKLRADVVAALRETSGRAAIVGMPEASRLFKHASEGVSPPPPKVELPAIDWNCVAGHRILTNCDHHGDLIEIAKLIRDGKAEIVLKEVK